MYKLLLFDLDGTLTASAEGITKSVRYALEQLGRGKEAEDLKALEVFVGPPLLEQFMKYSKMEEKEAEEAVRLYRERYNVTGLFENRPYEGIPKLLGRLREAGFLLGVASSKPEILVKRILEHFEMTRYFHEIVGSDYNRLKMTKADVIEEALKRTGFENRREEVLMIGDRHYDVNGAKEASVSCLGTAYGYGTAEELEEAGAETVVNTVKELEAYFFKEISLR